MAKETQIKLTKTRYRLGCLGVTSNLQKDARSDSKRVAPAFRVKKQPRGGPLPRLRAA
jgi:hypothetical protein